MGLNLFNAMWLLSHFRLSLCPSFLCLPLSLPPSLSPCQPADLWLCLSEGHTSLPTLLFVSTLLHFSTLTTLKPTRNQQKLTLGSRSLAKVGFVALLVVVCASKELDGASQWLRCCSDKELSRPSRCWEHASDIEK